MKEHIAKLWTEALRSNTFTQGSGTLESQGSFCCLGVLCKVAESNGIETNTNSDGQLNGNNLRSSVQPNVLKWAGLDEHSYAVSGKSDGSGYIKSTGDTLTTLNDGGHNKAPLTFNQIADVIDKYWEEL